MLEEGGLEGEGEVEVEEGEREVEEGVEKEGRWRR